MKNQTLNGTLKNNATYGGENKLSGKVKKLLQSSYIKILTWLRGLLVIFLYLDWFSLCLSLIWELLDNIES